MMNVLDNIYDLIKTIYSEFVRKYEEEKKEKIIEREENILIAISLAILGGSFALVFVYKENLESISFYRFTLYPLFLILFVSISVFLIAKVFFLSTRLLVANEKIKMIDEVYLQAIFGFIFIFFLICILIFYFSSMYKISFVIPIAYLSLVILLIIFLVKINPKLKLRYQTSKILAYIDRPPYITVTETGTKFNYILKNNSNRSLKKDEIQLSHTILDKYDIEINRVKKIEKGRYQLIKDIGVHQIFIIPIKISKKEGAETEILELEIKNKITNFSISKYFITLTP